MNPVQIQQLATLCCAFLIIWELIRRRFPGALLSLLALFPLVVLDKKVFLVFTILMTLPVVFEEHWNSRAQKDMIRAVLAAVVIAATAALLLTKFANGRYFCSTNH